METTVPVTLNAEEVQIIVARRVKAQEKFRKTSKTNQLRSIVQQFIQHEIDLEASGDAGSWNVEDQPLIKEARRVLALTDPDLMVLHG